MTTNAKIASTESPEELDVDEESLHNARRRSSFEQGQGQRDQENQGSQASESGSTLQKRRRVTRACDECRRKKIKCDGKQPCTHCVVYSYDCTYDQPSNRRRNPAPQYVEALEIRLRRAEALLKTYNSNVDLNDVNLDALVLQQGTSSVEEIRAQVAQQKYVKSEHGIAGPSGTQEVDIHSMFEGTGDLDIDDRGHYDFHGGSSGVMFLRRMREQFGGVLDTGGKPLLPLQSPKQPLSLSLGDLPQSNEATPHDTGLPNTYDLPSKKVAIQLCTATLTRACALLTIVHTPTFFACLDRIYDTPPESFTDDEHRFLPLLYQVLAVGCMFADDDIEEITTGDNAIHISTEQGMKFFRNTKAMIDITDCRDLVTLQTIIFMIMFLQAASNLSTCYSYIGVALRSALRLGLHRNVSHNFSPIESECRRRTFWTIRKMDTYVSALLGFPRMLYDSDIDQDMPIEVDDSFILKTQILPQPEGKISLSAACNQHTKLMYVLAKVIQFIYPTKGIEQSTTSGESRSTYSISHNKIREIEKDLQDWLDELPMALRPGDETDSDMTRCQQLLRLAYAHVQMMLYRPFLHYVSSNVNTAKTVNDRSYACAAACVSVSRNIVHITSELKRRGLLVGAYWFTMYTTFFAILSLVYFVLENPTKEGAHEILSDALAGKAALEGLARRSMAADRCSKSLKTLFESLPENLQQQTVESTTSTKKRPAPVPAPLQVSVSQAKAVQSAPAAVDAPLQRTSDPQGVAQTQRAATLPGHQRVPSGSRQPTFQPPPNKQNIAQNVSNIRRSWHATHNMPIPLPQTAISNPERPVTNTMQPLPPAFPSYSTAPPQLEQPSTLPDLSHMMFPSSDPFAYPNQPLIELDHREAEMALHNQHIKMESNANPIYDNANNGSSTSLGQPTYMNNNFGGYDALEGQLFGPLPPYLMHAHGGMDMGHGGTMDMNNHAQYNTSGVYSMPRTGQFPTTTNNMYNFNDIFTDNGNEWSMGGMDGTYR